MVKELFSLLCKWQQIYYLYLEEEVKREGKDTVMIGSLKWNNLHGKRKGAIAGECMGVLNEGCEKSTQLLPGNGRNRWVPWGNWDFLLFCQPRHQDVEGHKRLVPCVLQLHWGWWKGQTDRWLLTWGSDLADVEGREINTRKNTVRKKSWRMCEVFLRGVEKS